MILTKALVAAAIVITATLLSRRLGNSVGGWLVALPLTSAPTAYFLAIENGNAFAATAAIGMLLGTASQAAFILCYRWLVQLGPAPALVGGVAGFFLISAALAWRELEIAVAAAIVAAALIVVVTVMHSAMPTALRSVPAVLPSWDLWLRSAISIGVIIGITEMAPIIGPYWAGLLSPLPIFGAVLAGFAHFHEGAAEAIHSLRGLAMGLATPALFFGILAVLLVPIGLPAFVVAVIGAVIAQAVSGLVVLK